MATLQRVYGGDEAARPQPQRRFEDRLAYGLGWFSVGLGLAEVLAPKRVARIAGVKDRRNVIRAMGVRELTSGIGILATRRPAGWLLSRVGGDAVDLSLLGAHLTPGNHRRRRTAIATAAVAGVTALDVICSERLSRSPETGYRSVRVRKAIAVNRSPEEAYRLWRDSGKLAQFMPHLQSAEVIEDRPDSLISWRSGSNTATVRFEAAPGGRGTFVKVDAEYVPRITAITSNIARLFGSEPGQEIASGLREFKQLLEVGEIVKSDASIHSRPHPAQPPKEVSK
jgi:uncharacterized membrane protein